MARVRTSVMLDEELVARAKKVTKTDSASDAIEVSLKELLRRQSLQRIADSLGVDDTYSVPPRRREEV